jgi:hypothetical protein
MHGEESGRRFRRADRLYAAFLFALWITVALLATLPGLPYYLTPVPDRAFSPGHDLLKPSGLVGHFYGIAGTAMIIVGVAIYSARKRMRSLAGLGRLRNWLRFHIFLCTLGPFLVVLHTTLKVGGIVSIAFWSMTIVVASGVFGRWVYARIPMTVQGRVRDMRDVEAEMLATVAEIREHAATGSAELEPALVAQSDEPRGLLHALWLALHSDLTRGRDRRRVRRVLRKGGAPPDTVARLEGLFLRRRTLDRQRMLLHPFQRLFGYWHLLHLPLAIVLALVATVHVVVALVFGYAWLL